MADKDTNVTNKNDFISREAALELIDNAPIIAGNENETLISAPKLSDKVYCLPAADVRPVVLCRDCRHRDPEDRKCDSGEMERQGCVFSVDDDYFCAYGER